MDSKIKNFFFGNFFQKLFALFLALSIWLYINYTITETKVFPKIAIRVVNIPPGKTIRGLMPNGTLDKKITITLTGRKEVIDRLTRRDFEIIIDAANKGDEWVVSLDKRCLVSLHPDMDLPRDIVSVQHPEFLIKLSKLITRKVPVLFLPPKGEPPEGYQYLSTFPSKVFHSVTGPEEDVNRLYDEGLEVTLDLNLLSKGELDAQCVVLGKRSDEVSFFIPDVWKRVPIPFMHGLKQEISDPEAKNIRIDFLRKDLLVLDYDIPIRVFCPPSTENEHHHKEHNIKPSKWVVEKNGMKLLRKKMFVTDVSRLFLDILKDRIEIVIILDPAATKEGKPLRTYVQVIDYKHLEEQYIQALMPSMNENSSEMEKTNYAMKNHQAIMQRKALRVRFGEYVQKFQFCDEQGVPIALSAWQDKDGIRFIE